jgi:tetratricopeptide (TPR) repeat protein
MRAAGDFAHAKEYLSKAIADFQQIGDRSSAAEVKTVLAELMLDEGNLADGRALAQSAAAEFETEKAPRDESLAVAVVARALLGQERIPDAQRAVERATNLLQKHHDRNAELSVALAAARVRAAGSSADRASASEHLRQVMADATKTGFVRYALEARLALGELELRSGDRNAGHNQLEQLVKDANEKGFASLAHQAATVLNQSP